MQKYETLSDDNYSPKFIKVYKKLFNRIKKNIDEDYHLLTDFHIHGINPMRKLSFDEQTELIHLLEYYLKDYVLDMYEGTRVLSIVQRHQTFTSKFWNDHYDMYLVEKYYVQ